MLRFVPSRFQLQAKILLEQFNSLGTELNWNSDGVIFIDQVSVPGSNMFTLFPLLFKKQKPKNIQGLDDFEKKIEQMQLSHLHKKELKKSPKLENDSKTSQNIERLTIFFFFKTTSNINQD